MCDWTLGLAIEHSPATSSCKHALLRGWAVLVAKVLLITQHASSKHKLMGRDERTFERRARVLCPLNPKGMYQMPAAAQQL